MLAILRGSLGMLGLALLAIVPGLFASSKSEALQSVAVFAAIASLRFSFNVGRLFPPRTQEQFRFSIRWLGFLNWSLAPFREEEAVATDELSVALQPKRRFQDWSHLHPDEFEQVAEFVQFIRASNEERVRPVLKAIRVRR